MRAFMLLCLLFGIGAAGPVFAETVAATPVVAVAPSTTTVFFGNLLTGVLATAVSIIVAFLSTVMWKLAARFGVQVTAQNKINIEADLQTALQFGVAKAIPLIKEKGWDHIDVHNQIIADAAAFMLRKLPDRAAQLSVSGPLEDSLTARLPEAMTVAAESPATPPAPSPVLEQLPAPLKKKG